MHLFVALNIKDALKPKIIEIQNKLKHFKIKLVEPENLHFTLKFLGEISDKNLPEITSKLEEIAKSHQQLNLHISGIGVFPSESFIKVIWLGSEGLEPLMTSIHSSLSHLRKEDHPPQSHLTIARVSSYSPEMPPLLKSINTEIGSFSVDNFSLKKSVLTPNGPVYEDIRRFELNK